MDPRLRGAVDASVGWYEDLCTLHGVGSVLVDGLWSALGTPPPLHSTAVVVEPEVTAEQVLARLDGREHGGVKDSFATMDLTGAGLDLLFSATWIHREAEPPGRTGTPAGWSAVTGPDELFEWTGRHDTRDVLLPPLLRRAHFRILAKRAGDHIVAGAVARLGSGTVDVSNVYAVPGHRVDWAELAAVVGVHFPARPLVGYERGEALAAALDGGFTSVGELRVWVRPA
ncbi:hypothetical protein [Paractinoplanes toevensis]|uniref:Uncharacterized protein n=1 Tax=Paractinoplanes toevensis TaxID=571911 RepID=A0A919W7X5_9ACTN|nr:hypothetical protein [Actinoplanes toevensis]GIM90891.1 hypothetical protein Ato02nite_026840 [Actinoplanes toevensis]